MIHFIVVVCIANNNNIPFYYKEQKKSKNKTRNIKLNIFFNNITCGLRLFSVELNLFFCIPFNENF